MSPSRCPGCALALAAANVPGPDPGCLVGRVYAATTGGAIIGALGFSLFLIVWMGPRHAHQLLMGLSVAAALLMLAPLVWPFRPMSTSRGEPGSLALRIA